MARKVKPMMMVKVTWVREKAKSRKMSGTKSRLRVQLLQGVIRMMMTSMMIKVPKAMVPKIKSKMMTTRHLTSV